MSFVDRRTVDSMMATKRYMLASWERIIWVVGGTDGAASAAVSEDGGGGEMGRWEVRRMYSDARKCAM